MKSIPLTENEVKHIRETYELELERLQKRTGEISSILKKLKGIATEDTSFNEENTIKEEPRKKPLTKKEKGSKPENLQAKAETKLKGKRGRPPKSKPEQQEIINEIAAVEKSAPKKRGRKPFVQKVNEETANALSPANMVSTQKSKAEDKPVKKRKVAVKEVLETKPEVKTKAPKANKALTPEKEEKIVKKNKTEVKPLKAKKVSSKVENSTTPKKRGRKPSDDSKKAHWTASILDILNEKGKVLSSKDIISQVMKLQDIPAAELQKNRSIITGSLSDLKLGSKKVKTISVPGQKGQLYGLTQWFNELGQLVDPSRLQ